MFRVAIYAVSMLLVVACATPEQIAEREEKRQRAIAALTKDVTEPEPSGPEEAALKYVAERIQPNLKDPDSMKLELIPDSFYKRTCSVLFSDVKYISWAIGVHINAKNSYGAYTGRQPYIIHFRRGNAAADIGPLPLALTRGVYKCPSTWK